MRQVNIRKSESGNVLFLILIAVALFAALSYVVTQSTRSGGGSTEREKNILSSAQMTQYPTALRTSIIRMILGGVGVEDIVFNSPSNFDTGISVNTLVFHPQGGGASFQEAPADLGATSGGGGPLTWYFNPTFRIAGIGIDTPVSGNDLIAFLPGVSAGICRQANQELGVVLPTTCATSSTDLTNGVPNVALTMSTIKTSMTRTASTPYTFPTTGTPIAAAGTCAGVFDRKASGCFYEPGAKEYVFYSVLLER